MNIDILQQTQFDRITQANKAREQFRQENRAPAWSPVDCFLWLAGSSGEISKGVAILLLLDKSDLIPGTEPNEIGRHKITRLLKRSLAGCYLGLDSYLSKKGQSLSEIILSDTFARSRAILTNTDLDRASISYSCNMLTNAIGNLAVFEAHDTPSELLHGFVDTVAYLAYSSIVLIAAKLNIDLLAAIVCYFNLESDSEGSPQLLSLELMRSSIH